MEVFPPHIIRIFESNRGRERRQQGGVCAGEGHTTSPTHHTMKYLSCCWGGCNTWNYPFDCIKECALGEDSKWITLCALSPFIFVAVSFMCILGCVYVRNFFFNPLFLNLYRCGFALRTYRFVLRRIFFPLVSGRLASGIVARPVLVRGACGWSE